MKTAYLALAFCIAQPAVAQDNDCAVTKHCMINTGACEASTTRLTFRGAGGGVETHQVQIKRDLRFSYLLDRPDPASFGWFFGDEWTGCCIAAGGLS